LAKVFNLARVTTATAGTGTMSLGAASVPFLTFALAGANDGDRIEYSIQDTANTEKGIGTYNSAGPTLTRDFVLSSTNGGALINLSGSAQVFCDPSAQNLWVINTDQHAVYGGI